MEFSIMFFRLREYPFGMVSRFANNNLNLVESDLHVLLNYYHSFSLWLSNFFEIVLKVVSGKCCVSRS